MAKNDYEVLVFKILLYLYGVLKREISFDLETFDAMIERKEISEGYFVDVLSMMQEERLIRDLSFKNAWGGERLLLSDLRDARITPEGIRYLTENATMEKVKRHFLDAVSLTGKLIEIVFCLGGK